MALDDDDRALPMALNCVPGPGAVRPVVNRSTLVGAPPAGNPAATVRNASSTLRVRHAASSPSEFDEARPIIGLTAVRIASRSLVSETFRPRSWIVTIPTRADGPRPARY